MSLIVGIDLSLRSTGICAVDFKGNLIDFTLIQSDSKTLNDEELLQYNSTEIVNFTDKIWRANQYLGVKAAVEHPEWVLSKIIIEGLSFGGISGNKDILQGNFWVLRTKLKEFGRDIPIEICPVTKWRSKVISKVEQREAKKNDPKNGLKLACVEKLPSDVRDRFEKYLDENGIKRTKSKDPLWDICDAYWISKHGTSN